MPLDFVYQAANPVDGPSGTLPTVEFLLDEREEFFSWRGLALGEAQLQTQEQRLQWVEGQEFVHAMLSINQVG